MAHVVHRGLKTILLSAKVYEIFLSVKMQVPKLVIDLLKIMMVALKVTEDLIDDIAATVRGHHSPTLITPVIPATSDSPRYIPPHKRPNLRQLLET